MDILGHQKETKKREYRRGLPKMEHYEVHHPNKEVYEQILKEFNIAGQKPDS